MYDIYLSSNCCKPPDLSAFQNVAALTSKHSRLFEAEAGFLGLSLSGDRAAELIEQLVLADGYGYVVPVAYRQPLVTGEMARPIAERVVAQKQKKYFPSYTFEPVQFWREDATTWVFGAASEELGESGHIPGAVSTHIDKLDGHVWSRQEQGRLHLHGEEYYLKTATTLSPQHLLPLQEFVLKVALVTFHDDMTAKKPLNLSFRGTRNLFRKQARDSSFLGMTN